jgi:hypothetical protein
MKCARYPAQAEFTGVSNGQCQFSGEGRNEPWNADVPARSGGDDKYKVSPVRTANRSVAKTNDPAMNSVMDFY